MEITFSRQVNYSMTLDAKKKRELADHLDITVRKLNKLVEDGELYDEHGDELTSWMDENPELHEVSGEDDIEVEDINP